MVKSDLCQKGQKHKNRDCAFDDGGYFVIKGAEMVSYNISLAFLAYSLLCNFFYFKQNCQHLILIYVFINLLPQLFLLLRIS